MAFRATRKLAVADHHDAMATAHHERVGGAHVQLQFEHASPHRPPEALAPGASRVSRVGEVAA